MKKINILGLLLLTGCAAVFETVSFDSLNKHRYLPDTATKIISCEKLREVSYDAFYSNENQKCIKLHSEGIDNAVNKINKAKTNAEKLSIANSAIQSYEKLNNCKITKDLPLESFGIERGGWNSGYDTATHIVSYFNQAYNICMGSEALKSAEIERIVQDYESLAEQKEVLYKKKEEIIKLGRTAAQQKQTDDKLNSILSEIGSNSVLSEMRQVAPDFIRSLIEDCPIIFFIQALKDWGALTNSDLSSASNYKFTKNGKNTLVVKAGEAEFIFVKKENNKLDVAVLKDKDEWGNTVTSKNIFANNVQVLSVCSGYQNDDGTIGKFFKKH